MYRGNFICGVGARGRKREDRCSGDDDDVIRVRPRRAVIYEGHQVKRRASGCLFFWRFGGNRPTRDAVPTGMNEKKTTTDKPADGEFQSLRPQFNRRQQQTPHGGLKNSAAM